MGSMPSDTAWEEQAAAMVKSLGRVKPSVAAAMRRVPRHRFVPTTLVHEAYDDTPLPLGSARSTISAPHMVALMLEWAELVPGLRVLELGSGSGYLAALLAELVRPGGRVLGVELDTRLADESRVVLQELGYGDSVDIEAGDARYGWPPRAPYDRIVVSFATPEIFPEWTQQLATPGILLAPVGPSSGQVLRRLRRVRDGDRLEDGPGCIFVGLSTPRVRPK
jgi:protein-L-isoaspartate(D-aspartate) O-methyltransferase